MTCREEHPTRQNRARGFRLQNTLAIIAANWVIRRSNVRARNAQIRQQVIRQRRKQLRKDTHKLRRKVKRWKKEVMVLHKHTERMLAKHRKSPDQVSARHWDRLVKDIDKKVVVIYGKRYPQDKWPKAVPYLNMVGLAKWKTWLEDMEKEVVRIEAAMDREESIKAPDNTQSKQTGVTTQKKLFEEQIRQNNREEEKRKG